MRKIFLLVIGFFVCFRLQAQELDFNVKVTPSSAISKADPRIFKTLEKTIDEFINNNKWTTDEFEEEERIKGSIQITIVSDPSPTSFEADILIQSIRPVFNSDYSTQVMNYKDEGVLFEYVELQPLENNVNTFKDNLSSVLLFYIYYILGMDYDSFSLLGGERYFQVAQDIASAIPTNVSSADQGWNISNQTSRSKMIESLLSPRSRRVREASYTYHRLGLDEASSDIGQAKNAIMNSLKNVQSVNASTPNSLTVQMFMDSKRRELVDVFLQSDRSMISKVYDILIEIDPSQSGIYNQLRGR